MRAVIYNKKTGEIRTTISADKSTILNNVLDSEDFLETEGSTENKRVSYGKLVEHTKVEQKTLSDVKSDRIKDLRQHCNTEISNGFSAVIGGESFNYGFKNTKDSPDQTNLIFSFIASQIDPGGTIKIWRESSGVWELADHSHNDIKEVFVAAQAHKDTCNKRFLSAKSKIEGAETEKDILSVSW